MLPKTSPCLDLPADFRQLDEDHVAELLLREVGNPDRRLAALEAHPFVVFRVLQLGGYMLVLVACSYADCVYDLPGRL